MFSINIVMRNLFDNQKCSIMSMLVYTSYTRNINEQAYFSKFNTMPAPSEKDGTKLTTTPRVAPSVQGLPYYRTITGRSASFSRVTLLWAGQLRITFQFCFVAILHTDICKRRVACKVVRRFRVGIGTHKYMWRYGVHCLACALFIRHR